MDNSNVNQGPVVLAFDVGDGKVVSDFGSSSEDARSIVLQPDGKIVVAGNTTLTDNAETQRWMRATP